MQYIGEHLFPGKLGHFFVVLSFVTALLAAAAYFLATQRRETGEFEGWRKIGRFGFSVHALATFGIIGCLFFILVSKYYEYHYAWANVSDDLPFQYTFSAFWKEQQGSFLLWSFWHCVLGIVLIFRGGKWETPVLTVMALAEAFIGCMLLGLYFGDYRFGANPFDLLRDTMDAPIFAQADYLSKIKGNGLNPLLQNYWMTIHPPTLFLGFASTVVPFAFAIAGLWTRQHKEWLRPALNWSLFSGAILGTGILMGAVWAYEALSFGGYWAWDPVENSSLVPWLTLVAGIHTNLVARSTGYSIKSTYGFYLITFVLVLYSTYLTRSGILGDTSAHAFTEMGLSLQLIVFMAIFLALGGALLASRWRGVPEIKEEEASSSREFWMFIGSLVLFFSAILMIGATSLPVVNKIFGTDYAISDPVSHHNRFQLWIAVFIGLLSGVAQWLRYAERNWRNHARNFGLHMGIAAIGAAVITALKSMSFEGMAWQFFVMMFAGMFSFVANLDFLISFLRGNLKMAASAFSHIGFGILTMGILFTGLNKRWVSSNAFAMEGLIEGFGHDELQKNLLLLRDAAMPMRENYEATYLKDTIERQTRTFSVLFKKRDDAGNYTGEEFLLHPNVMYDRAFTKVVASNPSTKHYWDYDVFTNVSSLPKAELDRDFAKQQEDSLKFEAFEAKIGDTVFTKKHFIALEGLTAEPENPDYQAAKGDIAIGLKVSVHSLDDPKTYPATPMILMRPAEGVFHVDAHVGQLATRIRLSEKAALEMISVESYTLKDGQAFEFNGNKIKFSGFEKNVQHPDYQRAANDIAVAAKLEISSPEGKNILAQPVYLIRGTQVSPLPVLVPEIGLQCRFENINPQTETATFTFAQPKRNGGKIPVEIAENGARSDYIVLEAIVFPGINLVWVGSILMMFGLALGFFRRLTKSAALI